MGSGTLLMRAQKKYGIENFSKEIIYILESSEQMFLKENELVNSSFVERNDTYNITEGGFGGFNAVKRNKVMINGIIYKSQKDAAKALNKGGNTINRYIKSGKAFVIDDNNEIIIDPRTEEYNRDKALAIVRRQNILRKKLSKKISIDGVVYSSRKEVRRLAGICSYELTNMLNEGSAFIV